MSTSAAARAEARRKAILERGSDRLSKLTTSARGEDAPQFVHDDPPLPNITDPLKNFVGEESDMPAPRNVRQRKPSAPSSNTSTDAGGVDPSVWSEEQQEQLMRALMGGYTPNNNSGGVGAAPGGGDRPQAPPLDSNTSTPTPGTAAPAPGPEDGDDPLSTFLQQLGLPIPSPGSGSAPAKAPAPPPPSRLAKYLPLLHVLSVWLLLAYFVVVVEPSMASARSGLSVSVSEARAGMWARWGDLVRRKPVAVGGPSTNAGAGEEEMSLGTFVAVVPFFYAFTTLQLALHSIRIYTASDPIQLPMLLQMGMPHLPGTLRSVIWNGMRYAKIGNVFLDDVAALLIGVGAVAVFGAWISG